MRSKINKIKISSILLVTLLLFPLVSSAQFGISIRYGRPNDLNSILFLLINVLNAMIPILIGLAVLLFIWGLLRYYMSDNQNTKKEAVRIIGYGVVSIFVMVSLWGLVNLIGYSLNLNINGSGWGNTLPPKRIQI
ncbi:hypothetical protein GW764_03325 [Candidatus Parcubacteria bacterium]|nr:hypothetical protein [Candidatus Parcubacteria bacterium]